MDSIAPKGFTYIYTLADTNGVRYVGKSSDLKHRYRRHLSESKLKRTIKEKWISSKPTGEIQMEILDTVPVSDWGFYETYWIQQLKAWGYNLMNGTSGGEGSDGFRGKTHSPETREKLRINRAKQIANGQVSRLFGEANGRAKLSAEKASEIREKYSNGGYTHRSLAKEYGVSNHCICKVVNGERY